MTPVEQFFNELKRMKYFIGNDMFTAYKDAEELHEQQVKDAYNQGHREGKEDWDFVMHKDISEYSNAQNYYNQTFKK